MNTAIIVAAGSGSRFNSETPKQFLEILGKPILVHAIERFEACEAVDEIVIVVAADKVHSVEEQIKSFSFQKIARVNPGGATRAESVKNGLDAVSPSAKIVAVHDGARPLVSAVEIERTIRKAEETGAACLVGAVVDTIKHIEGGMIRATLDRNKLRRALTPQAFRYEILISAFREANLSEAVTDECYLVEKLGVPIAIVEGSACNIKITHPHDIDLVEMFLHRETAN
jgi:2-C-methyl-D-erythritol 4-phosphate cytidylyltransferase